MLTERQQQILDYVHAHQAQHGHFPTVREIQAHFGFASPFAVTRHLQALSKKGVLQRQAGKARAFTSPSLNLARAASASAAALATVGSAAASFVSIPLYGTIPAGFPTTMEQEPEMHIAVDPSALGVSRNSQLFALRVRGDSMVNAHILDGDMVFIMPRSPRPGEIVAALIDGESTLKRFHVHRGQAFLRAENPRYRDLLPVEELVIQGVMVGLLRPQLD